jgi:hypothetical protein
MTKMKLKLPRKRNPIARILRDPLFRAKRIPKANAYRRRPKHQRNPEQSD